MFMTSLFAAPTPIDWLTVASLNPVADTVTVCVPGTCNAAFPPGGFNVSIPAAKE